MSSADGVAMVVGGYEVVGRVGAGSAGTVFKARDAGLGRDVALKRVPAHAVAGLRAEAARLAALDDPHVVSVFGFVEEPGAAYLVLEWVEGATLAEVLAVGGKLSVAQALGVTRGALLGLAHAHSRGIVHGDVSATNVLVDTAGESRLIDFGVGGSTPAYRAPEASSGVTMTPAADVYAAAAVLVHLLSGQLKPDAVPVLNRVDAGIRPVLAKALAPAPTDRYPEAAAFLAALEEVAERTYGAAWWTTAGIPALVAPGVALMVPLGGGAAGVGVGGVGVGGVVGVAVPGLAGAAGETGRKGTPWKIIAAAGAAVSVIVAGGVTAVALSSGDDKSDKGSSANDGRPEKEPDPVVDTVPTGEYTLRQVVIASTDPSEVGDTTERIWTFAPDCPSADDCGGTIVSSSGSTFTFTWDGSSFLQTIEDPVYTEQGDCTDEDDRIVGESRLQTEDTPVRTFNAVGPVDPDTGFAQEFTSTYRVSQTIIEYVDFEGGPSRPKDCPFTGIDKIKRTLRYQVTVTIGADPAVVAAEEKRIADEKAAEEKAAEEKASEGATP